MTDDTIVAPATPLGRSALAIVRIDGRASVSILTELSRGVVPPVRTAVLVKLTANAALIDECIAIRYEAPHSFTGNDLVELTLHGNPLLVEQVLRACVALGARMAEPASSLSALSSTERWTSCRPSPLADLIQRPHGSPGQAVAFRTSRECSAGRRRDPADVARGHLPLEADPRLLRGRLRVHHPRRSAGPARRRAGASKSMGETYRRAGPRPAA